VTTIVWDGRILAADSLVTAGSTKCGQQRKLEVFEGYGYGFSGNLAYMMPMIRWARIGADPDQWPVRGDNDANTLVQIIPGPPGDKPLVKVWEGAIPHSCMIHEPDAWGSGARFALGALAMGATAFEAVAIAKTLDTGTGGDVHFIDTGKVLTVQRWQDEREWLEHAPAERRAWGARHAPFAWPPKPKEWPLATVHYGPHPVAVFKLMVAIREANHLIGADGGICADHARIIGNMGKGLPPGYFLDHTSGKYVLKFNGVPIPE